MRGSEKLANDLRSSFELSGAYLRIYMYRMALNVGLVRLRKTVLKVSYSRARLQAERFELSSSAWKADSLPLTYTRFASEEGCSKSTCAILLFVHNFEAYQFYNYLIWC